MKESAPKSLTQLSIKDFTTLADIKSADDINSFSFKSMFWDDGEACVNAEVNGVNISFWYCGVRVVGALEWASLDNGRARKLIYQTLRAEFHANLNSMFDPNDDLEDQVKNHRRMYVVWLSYVRGLNTNSSLRKEIASYFEDGKNKIISKDLELLI